MRLIKSLKDKRHNSGADGVAPCAVELRDVGCVDSLATGGHWLICISRSWYENDSNWKKWTDDMYEQSAEDRNIRGQ